jgi:hypothetical protein
MKNFQSESKKSGDKFEDLVYEDLKRSGIKKIKKNVLLENLGIEADFAFYDIADRQTYVEAKGGESGGNKKPGAKRTDNVKKAIANGALIKAEYPDVQFVVYFSELPKHGSSSHKMLKSAIRHGHIDAVRYLINYGQN